MNSRGCNPRKWFHISTGPEGAAQSARILLDCTTPSGSWNNATDGSVGFTHGYSGGSPPGRREEAKDCCHAKICPTVRWQSLIVGRRQENVRASSGRLLRLVANQPFLIISTCSISVGSLLCSGTAFAAEEPLPPLLPPHGELGPTFWEGNRWTIGLSALILLGAITLLVALLKRPTSVVAASPEVAARKALAGLRARPEDAALVGEVSRIFRRYLVFAFALPPEELTTTELTRALQTRARDNPELAGSINDFLRRYDEWKFAPGARATRLDAAAGAADLLEQIEAHRRQTAAAASQTMAAGIPPKIG